MKSIAYLDLLNLRQDKIDELTRSADGFVVVADGKVKESILAFLENENRYAAGKKGVTDRIAYLWGGRRAFSIIPFVETWNKAFMSGLKVRSVSEVDSTAYISFERI